MIAARLLVELGVSPDEAIAEIRRARSASAIETSEPEAHARAASVVASDPLPHDTSSKLPSGVYDRYMGALLGGAIGDALGAAFEFVASSQIESIVGGAAVTEYRDAVSGSLLFPHPAGTPTDDTAMTLALINSFIDPDPPITIKTLHARLCDRLDRDTTYGKMYWNCGPGGACCAMLRAASAGAVPFESIGPNAGGNGLQCGPTFAASFRIVPSWRMSLRCRRGSRTIIRARSLQRRRWH